MTHDATKFRRRDYQSSAIQKCIANWAMYLDGRDGCENLWANLYAMATGTGKTFTAVQTVIDAVRRGLARKVLFTAHRRELIDNAYDDFRAMMPRETSVCKYMADSRQIGDITIASVGSMHEGRIQEILDYGFDILIGDEMHHATEDNEQGKIISLMREYNPRLLYLGLSATPQRTDKVPFGWLYQDTRCVCLTMTLFDAIEHGWLVKLRVLRIDIEVGGVDVKRNPNGEIAKSEIVDALKTPEGKARVIAKWREFACGARYPDGRLTIAFCDSVDAAKEWSEAFNAAGIPSDWLADSNGMRRHGRATHERETAKEALQAGKIRVLFNVDVLTEGFNVREVSCPMFLRGTSSPVFLTQATGRGLRVIGHDYAESVKNGKRDCLVLDFAGATKAGIVTGVDLRDAQPEAEGAEGFDEVPGDPSLAPIDIHEIKTRTVGSDTTYEVDLKSQQVEPFVIDTISGKVAWIHVAGARVCALSDETSIAVMDIGGRVAAVYTHAGRGAAEQFFDDLDAALVYAESNIRASNMAEHLRPDSEEMLKPARHADFDEMKRLCAITKYDHGLQGPQSKAYVRGVIAYLQAVIELRSKGYAI